MDAIAMLLMIISVGVSLFSKNKEQVKNAEQKAARQREKGELSVNNMPKPITKMQQYMYEPVSELEKKNEYQKKENLKKDLKQRAEQRHNVAMQQQGSLGAMPLAGCYEAPAPKPLTGCYEESSTLGGQIKTEGDSFYNLSNKKHIEDVNYTLQDNRLNLLTDIQKSIIMAEVLGKPKALRRI